MQRKASDPPGETTHILVNIHGKLRVLFVGLTLSHDGHPRAAELLVRSLLADHPDKYLAAVDDRHCNTCFVAQILGDEQEPQSTAATKSTKKTQRAAGSEKSKIVNQLRSKIDDISKRLPGSPVFVMFDGVALSDTLAGRKSWNWMTPRDLCATKPITKTSIHQLQSVSQSFVAVALENRMKSVLCEEQGYVVSMDNLCIRPPEGSTSLLHQLQAVSVEVSPAIGDHGEHAAYSCRIHCCVRRLVPPAADKVKSILNKRRAEMRKDGKLHDNLAFTAAKAAGKLFKAQRTMGKCQVLDMKFMCDSDTIVQLLPTMEPARLVRLFWEGFPEPSALTLENRRRGFSLYEPVTEEGFWQNEAALGMPFGDVDKRGVVAEVQLLSGFGGTALVSTSRLTHACPILRCASRLQGPLMLQQVSKAFLPPQVAAGQATGLAALAPPGMPFATQCSKEKALAGIDISGQAAEPLQAGAAAVLHNPGASSPLSTFSESSLELLSQESGTFSIQSCDAQAAPQQQVFKDQVGTAPSHAAMFASARSVLPHGMQLPAGDGTKPAFKSSSARKPMQLWSSGGGKARSSAQLGSIRKRARPMGAAASLAQ